MSGAAHIGKDRKAHDILGKEEAIHLQHQRLQQQGWDDNRDIVQLRGLHRRHHATQGESDAVWQVVESMCDGSTPEEDRIRVWVDRGYQGTGKALLGATLMILHKRSKNHRILTAEQKAHSYMVSFGVRMEHSIGRLKWYARLVGPYDMTIGQFNLRIQT